MLWYQSAESGGYKAARRSRPPGLCQPGARWRPLRSYGRDAGRRAGDSFVASPRHLVNQISIIALPQGAHRMAPLVPVPSASQLLQQKQGSSGWRHWRVSPLRHRLGHRTGGPTDGAAGARPPVPLPASGARLG